MRVLDLFSGIGAFSLGLERAGMRTAAFCEIDPYCRRVLAKHWPETPCYDDVRSLTAERLRADGISVDVICGGFPCQDISVAGRGAGIGGERSGLWSEFARLIGELRPRYALVENVAALLGRGLGDVLGDLAALGYDAEWHCIPAAAVGAPQRRDRIWIVAYPTSEQVGSARQSRIDGSVADVAYPASERERPGRQQPSEDAGGWQFVEGAEQRRDPDDDGEAVAGASQPILGWSAWSRWRFGGASDDPQERGRGYCSADVQWLVEPNVGRVAHGVANRVDRLRGLGNSLVPQIPEMLGRAIMERAA